MSKVNIIVPNTDQEISCDIDEGRILRVVPGCIVSLVSSNLGREIEWSVVFQNRKGQKIGTELLLLNEPITVPEKTTRLQILIDHLPGTTLIKIHDKYRDNSTKFLIHITGRFLDSSKNEISACIPSSELFEGPSAVIPNGAVYLELKGRCEIPITVSNRRKMTDEEIENKIHEFEQEHKCTIINGQLGSMASRNAHWEWQMIQRNNWTIEEGNRNIGIQVQ